MKYDFREIEPKWQKKWDDEGVFRAKTLLNYSPSCTVVL